MGKFGIMKKALAMLVLVFLVASLTAASASACEGKEMFKGMDRCEAKEKLEKFEGREKLGEKLE
jgi:hypothetical protein